MNASNANPNVTYVSMAEARGRRMDGADWGTSPGWWARSHGIWRGPFRTAKDAATAAERSTS